MLFTVLTSCGRDRATEEAIDSQPATIVLKSGAFADGAKIPAKYTCAGEDLSPPLEWNGMPAAAKSLAVICDDPDAPMGTFTHWLLFNVPATLNSLDPARQPNETLRVSTSERDPQARQGKNDFGKLGYGGPCPPSGVHHYSFRIYALDRTLDLNPGADRKALFAAMKGHVLAQGRLTGLFSK
jgi:Raf kinase inhibitor-like YbhB/YbcL family protein